MLNSQPQFVSSTVVRRGSRYFFGRFCTKVILAARKQTVFTCLRAESLGACWMSRRFEFWLASSSVMRLYSGCCEVNTRPGWLHSFRRYCSACEGEEGEDFKRCTAYKMYCTQNTLALMTVLKHFQFRQVTQTKCTWKTWPVAFSLGFSFSSVEAVLMLSSTLALARDFAKSSYSWTCRQRGIMNPVVWLG